MGKIIGIDLGTTNSLAAYWDGKRSVLIPNRFGEYLTPSVVSLSEDGTFSVGKLAKETQLTAPERCAAGFKRGMGLDKRYALGDKDFSAEEFSAMVLRSLKEDSEAFFGEAVEEAVVSVPAYFGDKARRATRKAGFLAGLKVERIVNEPSAAALCFRQLHEDAEGNLLVFDFGGGTLDVSLVDCFENVVEITAVSGDNRLGGMDFDRVLAVHFCQQHNAFFENLHPKTQQQILRAAEQAKRMLTIASKVEMKVTSEELSGEWTITRKDLIRISAPLFERMSKPVQRVLTDGKVNAKSLAGVVLVGGSCKMPVVQDYVRYLLRGTQVEAYHPDMVVAMGVGIYAGIKERHGELNDLILTDICPFSLGMNVLNRANLSQDLMSVIIPRNSPLPTSRVNYYSPAADNQTEMRIGVYQGEDLYAKNNTKLDELHITNLPPKPAGSESVELRYSYDINGILLVDAKVLSTGEERHLILGAENDSAQTRMQIEMLKKLRTDPREDEEAKLLLQRAERLYQQLADQGSRKELAGQIERFEQQLTEDPVRAKKEAAVLAELLDKLEQEYFAFFQMPDEYMENFLNWYEDQQEDYDDQGWRTKN